MIRYLVIGIASIVLFFPAYWLLSKVLGDDIGAIVAAALMYIGFPVLMLNVWKTYPPLDVVPVDLDDPDMRACIERARREMHRFKAGLAEGRKEALVKYPVKTEHGVEHVWGLAHSFDRGEFTVSLVNEPVDKLSDEALAMSRARVPERDIEDWLLSDGSGRCEGGYTHLALVKIYRKEFGKVPKRYLRDMEMFVDIHPSEYLSD